MQSIRPKWMKPLFIYTLYIWLWSAIFDNLYELYSRRLYCIYNKRIMNCQQDLYRISRFLIYGCYALNTKNTDNTGAYNTWTRNLYEYTVLIGQSLGVIIHSSGSRILVRGGEPRTKFYTWIPLKSCTAMASPKFRFGEGDIQQKWTYQRLLKNFEIFIK